MADLIITIKIPDAKKADFRAGFLEICPVPLVNVATAPDPPDMQPEMTEKQWLKKVVRHSLMEKYRAGKSLLAKQTATVDEEVIEE